MTEPTPLVNTVESRRSVGRAIPATTTGGRPGVRVDAVRQLLPVLRPIADMSAAMNALADDDRPAPAGRPWIMANMVASIDGAYAVDGRSGGLGTAGDKIVFRCLRGLADVVLVGAGTARAEHYRRPQAVDAAQALRSERGQAPAARLVLVSRSGRVDARQRYLDGDGIEPLMVHAEALDHSAMPDGVQTLQSAGTDGGVDLIGLLDHLVSSGVRLVLCEGGPSLLGQLHRADLIDEIFVTTSPTMVGGADTGILGHSEAVLRNRRLHRLWLDDEGALLATWRRS